MSLAIALPTHPMGLPTVTGHPKNQLPLLSRTALVDAKMLFASKVRSPLTPHGGVCRTVNYRSERCRRTQSVKSGELFLSDAGCYAF